MSRQRTWQLEQIKQGRCARCGKKRKHYAQYCDRCRARIRGHQRRKLGYQPWHKGGRGQPPRAPLKVYKRRAKSLSVEHADKAALNQGGNVTND